MQKSKALTTSSSASTSKHKSGTVVNQPSSSGHPPLTRSRSASASGTTSRSNSSGSSSSGSSSSDGSDSSSSGSSSGSGSSSSSGTEASRGSKSSKVSRTSRSSQKSNNSTKKSKPQSKDNKARAASTNVVKQQAPVPKPSTSKKGASTTSANIPSSTLSQSSSGSSPQKKKAQLSSQTPLQKQQASKLEANKPKPKPKPMLSGSVINEKTISLSSSTPLLLKAKPTSTTARIINTKKKDTKRSLEIAAASSTDEDLESRPPVTLKRAGTKPKPTKQTATSKPKASVPVVKKSGGSSAASVLAVKKKLPLVEKKKKLPTATSRKKDLCLKSIFSPENSSADEEVLDRKKKKTLTKKMPPTAQRVAVVKKHIRAAAANAADSNAAAMYSSSLSATSSSLDSSSSSGSDSSSDEEEPEKEPNVSENVAVSSPKSSTGSRNQSRPVTRRQRGNVKSKTIPTTTIFSHHSQSSSVTTSQQQQQMIIQSQSPYITCGWGDSDFSDDPNQRAALALIRCPTKSSSSKSMRFPTIGSGGEEEFFERKCPFPSCDSQGHLSGKFPTHSLLSTCPKYHELSLEECKENAEERVKRDVERKKYYNATQPHLKKPSKLSSEAKSWLSKQKELKEKPSKKMDGLCSEYDHSLWSDALAHAASRIELEQGDGISVRSVVCGRFEMACWCESPYAEPLCHSRRIFICEFCLKPVPSGTVLRRHCAKCVWRHPPGDEIYRKDRLSVWEVDGKSQKGYCQNLCLLAKSFLDHKTLYLDVDPFLFYVMTLADSQGCHLVGYFSKEKNSFLSYNVSCILTLPPYQRQGFGRLLIDFSYLLTRVEGKVGSPEKPLSDLGLISYRSYWKDAVLRRMCACATREMNVKDLSIELGVTSADLISTLQFLGMLKYWKGKHLVLKKQDVLEEYLERVRRRGETRQIEPSCLRWRPFQPPVDQSSS